MKTLLIFLAALLLVQANDKVLSALKKRLSDTEANRYYQILRDNDLLHETAVPLKLLQELGIATARERLSVLNALREAKQGLPKENLPERLIFSINTGRSGSRYLASVLDSCVGVLAEHEPHPGPGGSRNMMHETWQQNFDERQKIKVAAIRKTMTSLRASLKRASVYAETNPNFKVWIWDVVIDQFAKKEGKRIDIMVVRKYIPALVKSIYELGWFQPPNPMRGESWLPTANGVNSLIEPLAPDDELDAYDKIISSIINTEAVVQYIMDRFGSPDSPDYLPNVNFYEYRSEELFDGHRALKVLSRDLELMPTDKTEELVGIKIDKYRVGKDYNGQLRGAAHIMPTDLHTCELRVQKYLQLCAERGIKLPELPHLQKYPNFVYE